LHPQEVADIIMDVIAESSNDFKDCNLKIVSRMNARCWWLKWKMP